MEGLTYYLQRSVAGRSCWTEDRGSWRRVAGMDLERRLGAVLVKMQSSVRKIVRSLDVCYYILRVYYFLIEDATRSSRCTEPEVDEDVNMICRSMSPSGQS